MAFQAPHVCSLLAVFSSISPLSAAQLSQKVIFLFFTLRILSLSKVKLPATAWAMRWPPSENPWHKCNNSIKMSSRSASVRAVTKADGSVSCAPVRLCVSSLPLQLRSSACPVLPTGWPTKFICTHSLNVFLPARHICCKFFQRFFICFYHLVCLMISVFRFFLFFWLILFIVSARLVCAPKYPCQPGDVVLSAFVIVF